MQNGQKGIPILTIGMTKNHQDKLKCLFSGQLQLYSHNEKKLLSRTDYQEKQEYYISLTLSFFGLFAPVIQCFTNKNKLFRAIPVNK